MYVIRLYTARAPTPAVSSPAGVQAESSQYIFNGFARTCLLSHLLHLRKLWRNPAVALRSICKPSPCAQAAAFPLQRTVLSYYRQICNGSRSQAMCKSTLLLEVVGDFTLIGLLLVFPKTQQWLIKRPSTILLNHVHAAANFFFFPDIKQKCVHICSITIVQFKSEDLLKSRILKFP